MRWFALLLTTLSACLRVDPFLYFPQTEPNKLEYEDDDPKELITPDRVIDLRTGMPSGSYTIIEVADRQRVASVYVLGSSQPPLGHVMFFHGQGATLATTFGRIKRLANLGFDVFAINYRGFGISGYTVLNKDTKPTEAGIDEDTRGALAFLRDHIGADTPLAFYGYSLGSAVAVQRALTDPPSAMVLEAPFSSLSDLATDTSGIEFPIGFIADSTWDTENRIKNIFAPLLLLHGANDDFIRPEFSRRIFANANDPKQLIIVPGAGHRDVPQTMGDEWDDVVRAHLQQ